MSNETLNEWIDKNADSLWTERVHTSCREAIAEAETKGVRFLFEPDALKAFGYAFWSGNHHPHGGDPRWTEIDNAATGLMRKRYLDDWQSIRLAWGTLCEEAYDALPVAIKA